MFAPAASSAAVPEAADFAQPLGEIERSAGADERTAYRSGVLEAPARFDLAGLEGEMREADLRGRVRGGTWTDWAQTANGDPVWFGGMDELQIRTHGWRPAGRVHYVSVSEGAPRASVREGARAMPNVISREQWGAQNKGGGCKPRRHADYGRVKAASVHHTVSAVDYSQSAAPGMVLGICRFHRNSNGWNDIGYNALVDRFGNIYEGRAGGLSRAVIGAQAQGVNAQTTGVAALGTHTSTPVSKRARRALVRWLVWKLPEHGLDGEGKARMVSAGGKASRYPEGEKFRTLRIIGHRETNYTACPGDALARELSDLRKKVIREIGESSGGGGGAG